MPEKVTKGVSKVSVQKSEFVMKLRSIFAKTAYGFIAPEWATRHYNEYIANSNSIIN